MNYAAPLGLGVIELAADDAGQPEGRIVASVEGIVRQARKKFPEAELVFLYAQGATPEVIGWHERVAEYYGIPSVNVAGTDSQESYGAALIDLVKQCKAGADCAVGFEAVLVGKFFTAGTRRRRERRR